MPRMNIVSELSSLAQQSIQLTNSINQLKNKHVSEFLEDGIVLITTGANANIFDVLRYCIRKGYLEDKEIHNFLTSKNIKIKFHSLRYHIKRMLERYQVHSRSQLLRKLLAENLI